MVHLPSHPLIYEINTWVWLGELERRAGRPLSLASVPVTEWDRLAALGFNAVWLMGVWKRSAAGLRISMANDDLLADFRRALPDFAESDNVGSPYCVRAYDVEPCLGGPDGLAAARRALADRGMGLILDFVPNHVAPDHSWVARHPEFFIQASEDDLKSDPAAFVELGDRVFACGRDPNFPAWPDVVQLNGFSGALRSAAIETLLGIADQCDGVRCDMAMLLINGIFARTWGRRAGAAPEAEYWRHVISGVRQYHPKFVFIAEAYWGLEWELQQQGFDYCYDKRLYDRLEHGPAESVRLHLHADMNYQEKLVRFVENHDEPRAASAFDPKKHRAAALTALTLPGARLVHEGQMEGRRTRLPVFLGRRPDEQPDKEVSAFYEKLLGMLKSGGFTRGTWCLCSQSGWPDNPSPNNLVSWCWKSGEARCVIVANLSGTRSQTMVAIPWKDLGGRHWRLEDVLSSAVYDRDGTEMVESGLFVDLQAWGCHLFVLYP